jgi:hypothetical protein
MVPFKAWKGIIARTRANGRYERVREAEPETFLHRWREGILLIPSNDGMSVGKHNWLCSL